MSYLCEMKKGLKGGNNKPEETKQQDTDKKTPEEIMEEVQN